MRLTATRGAVNVVTATGETVDPGEPVPPGGTVTTQGPQSSARLSFPEGTLITLASDSILTLTDSPRHLLLRQGSATADTRARPTDDNLMVLGTNGATLTKLSGAVTMVGYTTEGATEVGVVQGSVTVSAPTGGKLGVVYEGEMLTVQNDGSQFRQLLPTAPDAFSWDLAQPLPEGWMAGAREESAEGPVVRPRFWFDRYHQETMSQIRSNKQWTRGFFRLMPESVFRIRYWVDRPGPSQLCVCVRTLHSSSPDSGMLECNDAFLNARPKQWQQLEVRAGKMLGNKHVPEFGPPWIGFLVIFNTYTEDLGLKIKAFEVQPPA
ncbi:MAG: FecR domain-containing protein [Gemmataceae bacterium]